VLLLLLRGWAWGMRGGRAGGGVGWMVEGGLAAMGNGLGGWCQGAWQRPCSSAPARAS
jgi:hypothetical protein